MSVTKILFKHNAAGNGTLPAADPLSCGEPLWYKNRLYIRSQRAEELVNPDDYHTTEEYMAAVAQYRASHDDGTPVFIGPYEHPLRDTSATGVNVSEGYNPSTGISRIHAVNSSNPQDQYFDSSVTINVIDSIEIVRSTGHTVTANAQFSIRVPGTIDTSGQSYIGRWWQWDKGLDRNMNILQISSNNTSELLTLRNTGFGYMSCIGALGDYDWSRVGDRYSVETGDCLVVTDANWASNPNSPSYSSDPTQIDHEYDHMMVRSRISFDTTQRDKYLCQDGTWKTPAAQANVSASPGYADDLVGAKAGSVTVGQTTCDFNVMPANSWFSDIGDGDENYGGQGVMRPLGCTTGLVDANGELVLFKSISTAVLNNFAGQVLYPSASGTAQNVVNWALLPVLVDYHKNEDTGVIEAVPYVAIPMRMMQFDPGDMVAREFPQNDPQGTVPPGSNINLGDI